MPVLDDRYEQLALNDTYLKDPLLMALAWKKAHEYIRTTNWYADNFELDVSSIDLPNRCTEWVGDIQTKLEFRPLELVPAPKTYQWEFSEPNDPMSPSEYKVVWQPVKKCKDEKSNKSEASLLKLRPLAHVGIREQSIMTLVMMCLANEVESAQGDPSTDYKKVHDKKIVSYGNRLYCRYDGDNAEHSYGATTTYSKYFADYRLFLQRPYHFAQKELVEKSPDEEVYLVELDLSRFFDCIDRKKLVSEIRELADSQEQPEASDSKARDYILEAFESWGWSPRAEDVFKRVLKTADSEVLPRGLPQGLVASGFLANVYMASFDKSMSELIGEKIEIPGLPDASIKVADYCRYVDDMRIVLVGPNRASFDEQPHLERVRKTLLDQLVPELSRLGLEVNEDKTKIETFRGKSVGISKTLEDIQSNVSGPVAYDDAEIHLGQLESILTLSPDTKLEQGDAPGRFNPLAAIEKDIFDVREDTLKRFAANKISGLLNNIRHFTSRENDETGCPVPGDWDYLQERLARRFIACWSKDPALVLLLKKGLELFPSTKVLVPVLDQLRHIKNMPHAIWQDIPEQQAQKQSAVARYCLAEILRHASTVIHRKDRHAIPAHADIDEFFEVLQKFAVELVSECEAKDDSEEDTGKTAEPASDGYQRKFKFLADQARFLLLVRLDTTLESSSGDQFYDLIFKLATGFRDIHVPETFGVRDIAASILIARQLVDNPKPLLRSTSCLLENHRADTGILELIAIQDVALCRSLILHARSLKYDWVGNSEISELIKKLHLGIRPSAKPLPEIKGHVSIYKLISRTDNPFANELMALKLMLALLEETKQFDKAKGDDVIDLAATKIEFDSYSNPPSFEAVDDNLMIDLGFNTTLSQVANHLHTGHDGTFILQRIALCLRAVLVGSDDPTGFGQTFSARTGYRGLKSTQFKRQIGLLTTPESLVGQAAQFSGWLTTLLSKLLRWPGIRVNDQGYEWPKHLTIENVKELVEARLAKLKEIYCQQSGIPSLPELVVPSWSTEKKNLVVAMVQAKMPRVKDFAKYGPMLDEPEYRVKHRRHLARVSKLVTKHIEAQHIEKPGNGEREQDIDLIVLPELAVHSDDIDILVQLSRKTHAIIVAGLGFINQPGIKGPNNCAIWIVPRKHNGNKNEILRLQGKHHMMAAERQIDIQPWRPYQLMLELAHRKFPDEQGFIVTAAICFDATDISFSADMRDKSNALLIPALNKDVSTFDSMIEALHYHMYQHVVLVNTGEFGGSYAMAPYAERHKRLIAHSSGNDQVTINTFKMNMFDFRRDGVGSSMQSGIKQKTPPAGVEIKPEGSA
ncbi:RNA-directed DNA polymerase [Saccharospirillum salsuginis]|uniref:Reverse transcriptase domain-containing protein n=1 Tax=Saccharospirillum salsuginis TaxID=418750 RepID=A0A918KP15_9GAMM|nr:RNA-directed DNA polymerase [Saccharospirillum salsuginis]GGX69041.1 hypothetical protein GCM10007392_40900 [Saccharospirillum salsuginis]